MKRWMTGIIAAAVTVVCAMGSGVRAEEAQTQPEIVTLAPVGGEQVAASELEAKLKIANDSTRSMPLSGVVDLTVLTQISAAQVRELIERYHIPDSCQYLDGELRSSGDMDYTISRRNIAALTDPISLQYGVMTENTAVRRYPTWQQLTEDGQPESPDFFQETMLLIGEGVVVLHQTEDGVWSFVQGETDNGWVETADIAFCQIEDMNAYINAESFAVITDDELTAGENELRMGTRLPIARIEDGDAVVWLPESNENGNLYYSEQRIHLTSGICLGYLPFLPDVVVEQCIKMLDMPYGSGDAGGYVDSLSAVGAVYRSFGILLPRQADAMVYAGGSVVGISQMSAEEKKSYIMSQPAGCILLSDKQAAIYLGTDESQTAKIFHCVQSYSADGTTVTEANRCVETSIDSYSADGVKYLDQYQYVISF